MSIRDIIRNANDVDRVPYEIPEWDVKVDLVSPSQRVRNGLAQQYTTDDGTLDLDAMQFAAIRAVVKDPDTDEFVFDTADDEMLAEKNGKVVWDLFTRCMEIAGFDMGNEESDVDADQSLVDLGKDD